MDKLAAASVASLERAELVGLAVTCKRLSLVGRLAAGVTQELRSPLATCQLNLAWVEDELARLADLARALGEGLSSEQARPAAIASFEHSGLEETAAEARSVFADCAKSLERINGLLDGLRGQVPESARVVRPLDLGACARRAVSLVLCEYKHVAEIVLQLPDEPVHVTGVDTELGQVLATLLLHGIERLGRAARVSLTIEPRPQAVTISVACESTAAGGAARVPVKSAPSAPIVDPLDLEVARDILRSHGAALAEESLAGGSVRWRFELPS
jgi:C4-dicarboxylate-specific signal transduction histidine kinase